MIHLLIYYIHIKKASILMIFIHKIFSLIAPVKPVNFNFMIFFDSYYKILRAACRYFTR